jgi:hypothetical protein
VNNSRVTTYTYKYKAGLKRLLLQVFVNQSFVTLATSFFNSRPSCENSF